MPTQLNSKRKNIVGTHQKKVAEEKNASILLDKPIHTVAEINANRPDIVVADQEKIISSRSVNNIG